MQTFAKIGLYITLILIAAALGGLLVLVGCSPDTSTTLYQTMIGGPVVRSGNETVIASAADYRVDRVVGVKLSPRSNDFGRYDVAVMVQDDPAPSSDQYRFLYLIVPVRELIVLTDVPTTDQSYLTFTKSSGSSGDPYQGSCVTSHITIHVHSRDEVH